jgi:hypothetical protein
MPVIAESWILLVNTGEYLSNSLNVRKRARLQSPAHPHRVDPVDIIYFLTARRNSTRTFPGPGASSQTLLSGWTTVLQKYRGEGADSLDIPHRKYELGCIRTTEQIQKLADASKVCEESDPIRRPVAGDY